MCHATTTRSHWCRKPTTATVTVHRAMGCRDTITTGICATHLSQLERTGSVRINDVDTLTNRTVPIWYTTDPSRT